MNVRPSAFTQPPGSVTSALLPPAVASEKLSWERRGGFTLEVLVLASAAGAPAEGAEEASFTPQQAATYWPKEREPHPHYALAPTLVIA